MRKRSVCSVASFVAVTELRYCTSPIAARIEISEMTIRSSTRVKPALPVSVLRAIESLACCLGVHVEHIAASPCRGVRLVPVGAHPPFIRMGDRIDGNPAQELELDARRVVGLGDALHERLEAGRIPVRAGLDVERRDRAGIGGVLVFVDGGPHLPQLPPQLRLPLALDAHLRQRHDGRGEDEQDRRHHEQLDEGEAFLAIHYRTVTVTGEKFNTIGEPSGAFATPGTVMQDVPGATASKISAASRPEPEAPVWSPLRAKAMSTRPAFGSGRGANEAVTPPCRMNVPSSTVRTRSTAGV